MNAMTKYERELAERLVSHPAWRNHRTGVVGGERRRAMRFLIVAALLLGGCFAPIEPVDAEACRTHCCAAGLYVANVNGACSCGWANNVEHLESMRAIQCGEEAK